MTLPWNPASPGPASPGPTSPGPAGTAGPAPPLVVFGAPAGPSVAQQARTAVWLVVTATLLGALFGLLWAGVSPAVPVRVIDGGITFAEGQPEQLVAADGWFAILAVPFGVLLAVAGWLAGKRVRGVVGLAALVLGAVGAALLAWWLGRSIGLGSYQAALAVAPPGEVLERPPDLAVADAGWWPPRVLGVLLVPALAVAATYTLLAAWSRFPSLRRDDPADWPGPSRGIETWTSS